MTAWIIAVIVLTVCTLVSAVGVKGCGGQREENDDTERD